MRGDEHRTALRGQPLEQVAHPLDALGVESVDRLVEHDRVWIAEQRRGDAEALAHSEREPPDALARHVLQSDELDQLLDARAGDAVCLREREQVVVGGAPGVHRARLEQSSHLVERRGMVSVWLSVDAGAARVGRVEAQDQTHRGRLARAVGPQEAGHHARFDGERELAHRNRLSIVLRYVRDFDQGSPSVQGPPPASIKARLSESSLKIR